MTDRTSYCKVPVDRLASFTLNLKINHYADGY